MRHREMNKRGIANGSRSFRFVFRSLSILPLSLSVSRCFTFFSYLFCECVFFRRFFGKCRCFISLSLSSVCCCVLRGTTRIGYCECVFRCGMAWHVCCVYAAYGCMRRMHACHAYMNGLMVAGAALGRSVVIICNSASFCTDEYRLTVWRMRWMNKVDGVLLEQTSGEWGKMFYFSARKFLYFFISLQ